LTNTKRPYESRDTDELDKTETNKDSTGRTIFEENALMSIEDCSNKARGIMEQERPRRRRNQRRNCIILNTEQANLLSEAMKELDKDPKFFILPCCCIRDNDGSDLKCRKFSMEELLDREDEIIEH